MALSERLAYVLDFDVRGGVKSLEQLGKTADKELGKVESKVDKVGANLTKFGVGAVAFAGVAGVALMKTANEASDLAESVNAVNVTFGDSADGIKQLGEEAARSVGLATSEFNGLAVQFSSFAQTVAGGQGRDVVGVMDELTTRVADFASVMNLDVPEAARVFQSALSGETEPIKKFGIDLSAAAVEAYALSEGLIDTKSELTENIKVQARYGLLLQETAKTQGDFANTADGAANQQRILRAELKNASAEIGTGVLPVMTQLIGIVGKGVSAFNSLNDATGGNVGTIATYGVAAIGAVGGISALAGQVIKARDSIKSFATEMTTAKASVIGVTTVVTVGILAYQQYAKRKQEAIARTNEFITALGGEADAQNEAIDSLIAGKFANESYADALDKAGLSIADIVRVARGETVPAFEKLADTLDEGGTALFRLTDGSAATESELRALVRAAEAERTALGNARTETERKASATDELGRKTEMYVEFAKGMRGELVGVGDDAATAAEGVDALNISMTGTQSSAQQVDAAIRAAAGRLKRFGDDGVEQMGEVDEAVDEVKNSFIELRTEIENRTAYRDLQSGFDSIENAAVEAYTAAAEGADDAEQKARDYQQAIDDQRLKIIDYGTEIGNIPDEILTDILALVDEGKLAEAERQLELLTRERELRVKVILNSAGQKINVGPGLVITPGVVGAQGGIVNSPTTALIGEAGPEAVIPLDKVPGNQSIGDLLGGGGGDSVTVYAPTTIYNDVSVETVDPGSFFYDLERIARGLG